MSVSQQREVTIRAERVERITEETTTLLDRLSKEIDFNIAELMLAFNTVIIVETRLDQIDQLTKNYLSTMR